MIRKFTCIVCPNGCEIEAETDENGVLNTITGVNCPSGVKYVKQELTDPRRTISTSILIKDGELPLVSVRLTNPIPKERIFDVMEELKKIKLKAPVHTGDIVINNILCLGSDVMITKDVKKIK